MSPYELFAEWSKWWWPLLANHLWQATLFSLLALAAATSLRRAPALTRYFVWLVALVKFALPSALLFFLAAQAGFDLPALPLRETLPDSRAAAVSPLLSPVNQTSPGLFAADAGAPGGGTSGVAASRYSRAAGGSLYSVITCVWLAGCFVLAACWLRRSRALSASLAKGREMFVGREEAALRRVQGRLGLRREVRLLVTPAVSEPGVWGVLRPVVALPEGVSERLDDAELEAVFMHELSHIKRWDNLAGNLQRALCCVFWFHPVVWLIDRRLLAEREQACDDVVVRLGGASEVYVNGIAKVCRYCLGREAAGLAKVTGSDLKQRVERIVSHRAGRKVSPAHAATLAALVVGGVALSVAAGGGETVGRGPLVSEGSPPSLDPRFVLTAKGSERRAGAAGEQSPAESGGETRGANVAGTLPRKGATSDGARPDVKGEYPAKASDTTEHVVEAQADSNSSDAAPPEPPPPPREDTLAPHAGEIRAAVLNASDVTYSDPRKVVGRYAVDPKKAENFIFDITLEGGELWLKPSHSPKRRLIRKSETEFADAYSEHDFTTIVDGRGRVAGLLLERWGNNATARKLALPRPSLSGNVTFRLSGFADAKVVAVAGDFNDWNQSQFLFEKEGEEWVCRVSLPPGTYQYKFIADGNWLRDPKNPRTVRDRRGIENSFLRTE